MERPPPRSEFMESQTLRLDVVDVSRKMMHRTVPGIVTQRYVIEIFTDKDSYIVRKLYGQMRALSELLIKKYGLTCLELGSSSILTKNKIEDSKEFVKNINFVLNSAQYSMLKEEIRTHVYSFIVNDNDDEKEEEEIKTNFKDNTITSASRISEGPTSDSRVLKSTSIHSQGKISLADQSKVKQLPVKECWVLLHEQWHHFKPLVIDSTLIFQGTARNHYFYMKGATVEMKLEPYCHIEFNHRYDKDTIHIRMDPVQRWKLDRDRYEPYLLFYSIIRELAKCNHVRLDVQTVGKCCLELVNLLPPKQMEKQKENAEEYFIKLTHEEAIVHTLVFSPMHTLGIVVHMPIISPYGIIKVEVFQKVNSWIHKNPVDQLISNDDIEVQEVYKCINTGHQLQYVLAMLMQVLKLDKPVSGKEMPHILLTLRLRDESSVQSYFVTNDRDRCEGQEVEHEYSKEELRISTNRCKRVTANISEWLESVQQQLNFRHPARGYFLYGLLMFEIWLFDFNRILEYLMFVMVAIALWLNPTVRQVAWQLLIRLQLRQFYQLLLVAFKLENPHYLEPQVRSIAKVNRTKLLQKFQLKMKKKRSLYGKYKRLMEVLFFIQQLLTVLAENLEKLKNMLNWTHRRKTAYFIGFGSLAYVFLSYFPIRLFLSAGLMYNMYKHKNFYPKVYIHNKAVVMEIVKRTYMHNQKDLQQFHANIVETKRYIDPTKSYYPVLQRKLVEMVIILLGLDVNENLVREYTSVEAITQVLSTYGKRLRIDAKYRRSLELYDIHPQWFTDGSRPHRFLKYLHSYLYNVPSDRYLMECPPAKLKQLTY